MLVDALSEGLKDAETPEQWAIQRKLIEGDVREGVGQYPALETIDVDRSFDQMRAVPPLRQFPPDRIVCGPGPGGHKSRQ